MFQHIGPLEIGLILLLVLIIFGAGKLPEVGAALGKGIRQFNKARTGEDEEKEKSAKPGSDAEKAEKKGS